MKHKQRVELFGVLELHVNPSSKSGYKDVYPVRKKWHGKIWDSKINNFRNVGIFKTPREAAVAVAEARSAGIELIPSPTKRAPKVVLRLIATARACVSHLSILTFPPVAFL